MKKMMRKRCIEWKKQNSAKKVIKRASSAPCLRNPILTDYIGKEVVVKVFDEKNEK